eukprot:4598472-Alexandrium_andersonii.AAC.1
MAEAASLRTLASAHACSSLAKASLARLTFSTCRSNSSWVCFANLDAASRSRFFSPGTAPVSRSFS